jgi:undecaprenyl-diphosphatase
MEGVQLLNLKSLLESDVRISSSLRVAEKPGGLRRAAALIAHSGDSWFWGIGLGIAWLIGSLQTRVWSTHLIGAIILTAIIVMALKVIFRRRRPEGEWGSIYRNADPHSFPSGHAARAFLLAVMVTGMGPAWLAASLLIWAPLVALARVAMGVHYVSDVLVGGLLGAGIGTLWVLLLT